MSNRPLSGIKVLDLSRVFAGPVAGRTLSDLGADVVKVEPPDGDVSRTWGRKRNGQSTYYVQQNAGKRNVCIDLSHPDGPAMVAELADAADVLIENFRPGVMKRYGLDWAALSARNPRLVMLSISGFGQEGPESQRAAYASIAHSEMGLVSRFTDLGEGAPHDISFSAADVLSGLHGVIGILAALRHRDNTGEGQHIDISMLDAMGYSDDSIIFHLDGTRADAINGEVWQAVGGPVLVAGGFKWLWNRLSNIHGLADPAPADADVPTKIRMRREVASHYLLNLPDRAALRAALDKANLAWGDVRKGKEVLEQPTVVHRKSVVPIDDRAGGTRLVYQSPYRFSSATSGVRGPGSHRGEHNLGVLHDWLGDTPIAARFAGSEALLQDEYAAATEEKAP